MLITWALVDICSRQGHHQHTCWWRDPESRDKASTVFPLTIWCRLNYRWMIPWWCCTSEVVLTPALEGNWPITWIHWLKSVEPFWLRIYDWSSAWPIKILENNTSEYNVTLCHVFYNCPHYFYCFFASPFEKRLVLKLIVIRIWLRERSPQSHGRLPLTLCIWHLGLTHVLFNYTV